jgi:outer membrane protein OmpA-like peptidoglycan-associated protein
MKYQALVIACFFILTASAQLPILVKDEFNNNANAWWTGSGDNYSMKLENGKYIVTTTEKEKGRIVTITPYFDKQKDFSLEASFVQKSGSDNNGLGLLWGDNGDGKYQEFIITSNGYYKIKSAETRDDINKWVEYKVKPMGSENVLKVEQRKSKWYYYINGDEVASIKPLPLYGLKIGIVDYTNMVLEVDNFIFRSDVLINLPPSLPSGLVKENLGPQVNTAYDDLGPHITADGRTIMYGVENSPDNLGGKEDGEDIWVTTSTDGKTWSKSTNMGSVVNSKDVNNLAAISADNNMLLFCKSDGFEVRKRTQDGWSQPEYLNVKFKNESSTMEGNLSPDGKAILFTSKLSQNLYYKTEGKEKDVYVSIQEKDGVWSAPINLGKQINTAEDEVSPFLASDGRTLYFASSGRPGYGGHDIFMSKRQGDGWTSWSEPLNLGPEINSIGFDAYYTLPASADYAYLVSNTNSYGAADLVRVKLPEAIKPEPVVLLLGRTLNVKTKNPMSADILFEDLAEHKEVGEAISDPKTGSYRITLPNGRNYGIRAVAKGFLSVNENLELITITKYTEIQKDLFLVPIEVGETMQLNNVFFEQGRPALKSQSFPELDRLVQIMVENPTVKIEVSGHTDNVGNKDALLKLSEDRVLAVKAYLEKKGIKKDRVDGKGYGATQPIAPNSTEENRQRNRRVEFKITKK